MHATALQDMRRIWRVTTVQRDERSMLALGWFVLAIGSLGLIGIVLMILANKEGPMMLLRMLAGFGAFWLGVVWMMLFVPASVLLNSPANARLVPRQRRRLMQMAAGTWFIITAGLSFATGEWAVFPGVGLSLIAFALMRSGRNEALPFFLIGINWQSLSRHVLPPAVVDAIAGHAGLLVLSALLLPAGAWALRSLYPAGGDGHLARRGEHVKRANWFERQGMAHAPENGRLSWWTTTHVYRAVLRNALRRPQPGKMLVHALGPVVHWSAWIVSIGGMLLVGVGLRLLLAWRGGEAVRAFMDGAMGAGLTALVIVILFSTAAFSQQIRKTTGEQSLLRLTPLAGDTALLNRRLAVEMLKGALRNWVMLSIVVLLVTMLVGGDGEVVARQAAACVLAGQVALMGLLGDFADDGGWNLRRALLAGLLAFVEILAALGLARIGPGSTWTWLAAIAIAVGAVQLRHAWRAMLAAPPAFPAGRMS